MKEYRIAIIGIGATGSVLAAALLKQNREIICIDPKQGLADTVLKNGLSVSGVLNFRAPVKYFFTGIQGLKDMQPDLIFISTKTYHLSKVIKEIKTILKPGIKIISTHNGLGTEDTIAEEFGPETVLRMSLNFGASIISPNHTKIEFFDKPNHIGSLDKINQGSGRHVAELLTKSGLDTLFVDDIKHYVWRKMISKIPNASLCAVTGKTIKDVLQNPFTRNIAENGYIETLAVAKAMGYDFGNKYLEEIIKRMEKIGHHKDSMSYDIANKLPTEIDYLGGKIVEYANDKGISVSYTTVMTNLVKALENSYNRH
jgi:2-dehydropantoate 2-reductase